MDKNHFFFYFESFATASAILCATMLVSGEISVALFAGIGVFCFLCAILNAIKIGTKK